MFLLFFLAIAAVISHYSGWIGSRAAGNAAGPEEAPAPRLTDQEFVDALRNKAKEEGSAGIIAAGLAELKRQQVEELLSAFQKQVLSRPEDARRAMQIAKDLGIPEDAIRTSEKVATALLNETAEHLASGHGFTDIVEPEPGSWWHLVRQEEKMIRDGKRFPLLRESMKSR